MSFHTETHTISISGGVGSSLTNHRLRGVVHQILITLPNELTDWNYELLEQPSGVAVHGLDVQTGSANATFGVEVPMVGTHFYNINFFGVTADEPIIYRISVKENVY